MKIIILFKFKLVFKVYFSCKKLYSSVFLMQIFIKEIDTYTIASLLHLILAWFNLLLPFSYTLRSSFCPLSMCHSRSYPLNPPSLGTYCSCRCFDLDSTGHAQYRSFSFWSSDHMCTSAVVIYPLPPFHQVAF